MQVDTVRRTREIDVPEDIVALILSVVVLAMVASLFAILGNALLRLVS